jgi:hypothetical protein
LRCAAGLEHPCGIELGEVVAASAIDNEAGLPCSEGAAHRSQAIKGRVKDRASIATSNRPMTLTMVVRRRNTMGFYAAQARGSPKIPGVNILRIGARALAGGARKGNGALAGVGAAMVAIALLRRTGGPRRRLLYARTLEEGETLRIAVRGAREVANTDG